MNLVDFAQIVTALVTTAGVVWSLKYSKKTIEEVNKDRLFSRLPFLLFDYDFGLINLICYKRPGEGYTNNSLSQQPFPKSETNVKTAGILKNYGSGPAIDIKIVWVAETVFTSSCPDGYTPDLLDNFSIEENKTNVHSPHLDTGQTTGIHTIPYFIHTDSRHEISRVNGHFIIKYKDTFGNQYETKQGFYLFTNYEHNQPSLHISFIELVSTTAIVR